MHCSAVFGVTLRLLVINISSLSLAINTAAYYQQYKCHNLWDGGSGPPATVLTTPACCSINSRQWSQILAQNRDFCLRHLHLTPLLGGSRRNIAMPFGMENLEWCVYPERWSKILEQRLKPRRNPSSQKSVQGSDAAYGEQISCRRWSGAKSPIDGNTICVLEKKNNGCKLSFMS